MKALGFLAALLMTQVALAYPAVGDFVKYSGVVTGVDGTAIALIAEMELTSFDAAKQEYMVKSSVLVGGQVVDSSEVATPVSELLSRTALQELIRNCKANGGQTSKARVPAGTYDVCLIGQSDGHRHTLFTIGDVPFGIVKSESRSIDGSTSSMSLQEVRFGN